MSDLRGTLAISSPQLVNVSRPFSNFSFIAEKFGFGRPIHRIFSQIRFLEAQTLIIEQIASVGFSADDDLDLKEAGHVLIDEPLIRLGFFTKKFEKIEELSSVEDDDFIGYVILKKTATKSGPRFKIFESVLKRTKFKNNYIHRMKRYNVNIGGKFFNVAGVIYGQQNGITNVCAHVALRTCLSLAIPAGDFSYRKMNKILSDSGMPFDGGGLSKEQILKIIESQGIKYRVLETEVDDIKMPYQAYLYSSIESGYPALLGFSFEFESEGKKEKQYHIIPVFGHTFNQDTWVPNAERSYFKIGKDTRYIPSEAWVSTYICHDDNFGSNFCLPRLYLSSDALTVIALRPKEAEYDGIDAEAVALDYLNTLIEKIAEEEKPAGWMERLIWAVQKLGGWVVLRASFVSCEEYIEHLKLLKGWDYKTIPQAVIVELSSGLPSYLWIVEISLPEIFSANRRKLGEIVLNATIPLSSGKDLSAFLFARILNKVFGLRFEDSKMKLVTLDIAEIDTHTDLFEKAHIVHA